MNQIFKKNTPVAVPVALLASVLLFGCAGSEHKTETTSTETVAPAPTAAMHDSLPPLDSSAAIRPEEKVNGPKK